MNLGLRTTGRAAKALSAEVERELTSEDIDSLLSERGTKPPTVIAMRERHHALARLIAEGRTASEAAALMRYTQSRVSILLSDPAFQELITHYREIVNEQFVDFQKKLADLSIDAATILQERMEDDPDKLSDALLLQVVTVGADRTGHGPSQKSEVNVKIGLANRLAVAAERMAQMKNITPPEEGDQ